MARLRKLFAGPDRLRFDRSSWITLSIAVAIFIATVSVVVASYRMPMDGWLVDRGAWGRYSAPVYLEGVRGEAQFEEGDILVAVEGVPFEQLEAQAAALKPARPANWKRGETVRYTILRDDSELQIDVNLVRPPLLSLYHPLVLAANPILLTFPIFLIITTVVFLFRPRERPAQLLFLFGFAFFNDNLITWAAVPPGVADLFSPVTYWPKIILGNMSWSLLIGPLLVHLFLIFPVRKRLLHRIPRLTPILLYGSCAIASAFFVAWNVLFGEISGVAFVTILITPCLLVSTLSLIHSFVTVEESVARMQARWIALGGVVGIVGPVGLWAIVGGLSPSSPSWQALLFPLMALVFPLSMAVAILRYRLWDIDIIINRTLVYGALTGSLAVVYFTSVVLLQRIFPAESSISIVLSTLSIAAIFSPLRHRIQDFIDRRFYRRKYDAEVILREFAAEVRDEVDLERLSGQLSVRVGQALQPSSISLWLKESH